MKLLTTNEINAYHEAGHAVVAELLGVEIDTVSISTDPPVCKFAGKGIPNVVLPEIALAAVQAVNLAMDYYGDQVSDRPPLATVAPNDDYQLALDYVTESSGKYGPPRLDNVVIEVKALLKENWNALDLVARKLLAKKTLSHDDVVRAIWPWLPDSREIRLQMKYEMIKERHAHGGTYKRIPRTWRSATGRTI